MSAEEFAQRYRAMQRYVGWLDDDAVRVAALKPLVDRHASSLIADFYAEIQRTPEAAGVITGGPAQIERLSRTLHEWLDQLLSGQYDDAYMARRWNVGYRHVEIGLAQRYASLAMARLRAGLARCVWREWQGTAAELQASLGSLHKLLDLDHALIQDAYEFEYVRRERSLERERSEQLFRQLVENANCLIVILNSSLEAVYFNPFAVAATGFTDREVRESSSRALEALGSARSETEERVREVFATGRTLSFEVQLEARSVQPRWINWTLSRLTGFDDGPAVLAVGVEVTEQKQAATRLLQASRLATIGEMYARLAHESRNALQRLRVCSEMLADQVADQPAVAALVDRSQRAQNDLQRLLDEVRNFAAPLALDLTDCRLAGLWREAWGLVQSVHKDRRAKLLDDDCDPGQHVSVDRFRMVQAFRNIFENSLAACEDPTTIRIACRQSDEGAAEPLEIVVDDNGPGFPNGTQDQAFEPFFTTKSAGTGLGLAIVRRIVEAHGGRVRADSASPHGARISIWLPAQPNTPS